MNMIIIIINSVRINWLNKLILYNLIWRKLEFWLCIKVIFFSSKLSSPYTLIGHPPTSYTYLNAK